MVSKNASKQVHLRNRVYKFFEKNKNYGKKYTVNHFTAENFSKRTIYSILKRFEHSLAIREPVSGANPQKCLK